MKAESFEAEIPADSGEAERLLSRLRDWLGRLPLPQDRFAIELLCREAVENAVLHGCGSDPGKRVRVLVERGADTVSCMVEDEGEGFTPSIKSSLFDLTHEEGGMGLAIISHYADRISLEEGGRVIRFERRMTGGIGQ